MGIIFAIGCKSPFRERLLLARQSQLTPSRFYTIEFTSPMTDADAHAPFQEDRQSPSRGRAALHVLQFLSDSPNFARHSGNGSRSNRSCLVAGRACRAAIRVRVLA